MSAEGIAAEILNENRVNHARAMTSVDSVFPKQQASTNRSPDNLTRSVTLAKQNRHDRLNAGQSKRVG